MGTADAVPPHFTNGISGLASDDILWLEANASGSAALTKLPGIVNLSQ